MCKVTIKCSGVKVEQNGSTKVKNEYLENALRTEHGSFLPLCRGRQTTVTNLDMLRTASAYSYSTE